MTRPKVITPRYTREEWLQRALEVLAAQGPSRLNIGNLCNALGVSRGSFYWHFDDRNDFIHQLLELWHREYTARVPEEVERFGGSGREKFHRLVTAVLAQDLTRFDMPIRSWAMQDPEIAALVTRTDHARLGYIIQLFSEMGYSGPGLNARARMALAGLTMHEHLLDTRGQLNPAESAKVICDILCGDD